MSQNMLGVMVDCSRNALPTLSAAKRFIDCMEKMGYNTLMYYTEDTYEVKDEPYFGYLRGRFSSEELKELDRYAASHGIELIPCVQTLAHLNAIFRWPVYHETNDTNDILLVGNDRTMKLIENMFKSLRACFSTDKIHIGMDEAHMLGLGKYLDQHGFQNRSEILLTHLNRVCELAEAYGFRPMMWSDMFFRLAGKGDYYSVISDEAAEPVRQMIPRNLTLVYWDYYNRDPATYGRMIEGHKKLSDKLIFAGGVWTWSGFVPDNRLTMATTQPALSVCEQYGVKDVFFTAWGDNGAECSLFAALPTLFYAAERYRGNEDMDSIKEKFHTLFGEDYDKVLSIGDLDIGLKNAGHNCSSKITLYNDVLLGIYDNAIADDAEKQYAALAETYESYAAASSLYALHFTCYAKLARVLEKKCRLGIRLRNAYKANDRETLTELAEKALPDTACAMREFLELYRRLWLSEKKPHGFDVQELRIGGAITRIESAAKRVKDYLNGTVSRIDELEETILDAPVENIWARIASANVI